MKGIRQETGKGLKNYQSMTQVLFQVKRRDFNGSDCLLGRQQPRYQEALKQSPPSEACLSFHAAVLRWPTGRHHSCERMQGWASQQSSQGPRLVTLLVEGSLQGRYARLHMVYQLSLPVVVFSLQTKNEDSETWVGWSSQPKFASDIYLIEPLGLHCLLQLSGD